MRPSLIPSAIEVVAANQKNFEEFSFFEIGRSYLGFENERSQLVVGMYSKNKTRFVELENVIEKLLSSLNINYQFSPLNTKFSNPLMDSNWSGMHPHEFLNIQVMGKYMGVLNTLHPVVMKNFKMKGYFSFAVIDLTEIEHKEMKDKIKYSPLAKFPTSTFEVTVVMDKNSPSSAALTALGILKAKEIKSKSITDVFIMDDAKKAVSMRMVFEDREKTLAPETIKDLESKIIQTLEKAGFFLRT
jgi:phenylalanyl-tRNA synthetase beta chain